jgi:hypothetical protein
VSGGCTDCGRKGGCDHRKGDMFAALDAAMQRLYPDRRWGARSEPAQPEGVPLELIPILSGQLAARLKTLVVHLPGGPDETCDYLHVLCLGRAPSLLEIREGLAPAGALFGGAGEAADEAVEELYLRVVLSTVAPFAAVQQVGLIARADGETIWIEETVRAGVFDPVLLPRFRTLVAVLIEHGLRHLDFGEIAEAPSGYDPGDYGERYGGVPGVANYLFYPQPSSSITTTVLSLNPGGLPCPQS